MQQLTIGGIVVGLVIGAIAGYALAPRKSAVGNESPAVSADAKSQAPKLDTSEAKIANAMSAAPQNIGKDATILDWPSASGTMATLREGTNGWTCVPDYPASPGNDPLCGDEQVMQWFAAYMKHEKPKLTQAGISYMLQGASDASNDDPFAESPPQGMDWMSTGPHIMLFLPGNIDEKRYGTTPGDKPWVMYAGTPYEHIMVPLSGH